MRVCAHKRRRGSCGSLRGCATMQVHVLIHSHIADRVSQPLSTMGSSETVNKPPLPLKTSQKLQQAQRGMPTPDPDLLFPLACLADHNSKFSAFRHYSGHVTPCMSPLSTMLVSARTSLTSSLLGLSFLGSCVLIAPLSSVSSKKQSSQLPAPATPTTQLSRKPLCSDSLPFLF